MNYNNLLGLEITISVLISIFLLIFLSFDKHANKPGFFANRMWLVFILIIQTLGICSLWFFIYHGRNVLALLIFLKSLIFIIGTIVIVIRDVSLRDTEKDNVL